MDVFQAALLLQKFIKAMAINAEIEAMKALNQYRESRGETIAYNEDAFYEKAKHLWNLVGETQISNEMEKNSNDA